MIRQVLTTFALALVPAALLAQTPPAASANPSTDSVKVQFGIIKTDVAKTAAKVPEELLSFKPTPEIRSLGELLGHVADSQFAMCAAAAGEKAPQSGIEKSMKTKAELTKAVNDSNAYCDKVIASMDDKKGME